MDRLGEIAKQCHEECKAGKRECDPFSCILLLACQKEKTKEELNSLYGTIPKIKIDSLYGEFKNKKGSE